MLNKKKQQLEEIDFDPKDLLVSKNGKDISILYKNKPLGSLKWGHPALTYVFGERMRSPADWDEWWKTESELIAKETLNLDPEIVKSNINNRLYDKNFHLTYCL